MTPPGVIIGGRFVRCTDEIPMCIGAAARSECTCPRWTREQFREAQLCQSRDPKVKIENQTDLWRAMLADEAGESHAWRVAFDTFNKRYHDARTRKRRLRARRPWVT